MPGDSTAVVDVSNQIKEVETPVTQFTGRRDDQVNNRIQRSLAARVKRRQRQEDQDIRGQDFKALFEQNLKLERMVLVVVEKLELFIQRTIEMKEKKRQILLGQREPENEVLTQKSHELDSYLYQLKQTKR